MSVNYRRMLTCVLVVRSKFYSISASAPEMQPYTDFLMKWGHFLIGLSLISGSWSGSAARSASCS